LTILNVYIERFNNVNWQYVTKVFYQLLLKRLYENNFELLFQERIERIKLN
jgi:hypothetical protein